MAITLFISYSITFVYFVIIIGDIQTSWNAYDCTRHGRQFFIIFLYSKTVLFHRWVLGIFL